MSRVVETPFTELDASRLYARLVNELDPEPFLAKLAPDVRYRSQFVFQELEDRESVANHLRGKINTIRETRDRFNEAVIGVAMRDATHMPLVILFERESRKAEATVSFEITAGQIKDISICVLPVFKPAILENPDTYAWPRPPEPVAATPEPAPKAGKAGPDPAEIIATFADVLRDHRAPIDADMIAAGHRREWGNIGIDLVPHDDPRIVACDWNGITEAREAGRDGDRLLFLLSWVDSGEAIGVVTLPRPATPWTSVPHKKMLWHMRGGKMPFDFDVYCELGMFGIAGLMYEIAPVVMRPRPDMPLDELERRYRDLERTAGALRKKVHLFDDLTTWPRFLAEGANAARDFAARAVLAKLRERGEDGSLAALDLDAWSTVAADSVTR